MPEMERRAPHALDFDNGRLLLGALPNPAREMALLSMTTSMNVAEMPGLRWKQVNLTEKGTSASGEFLAPFTLAVRENYYRGKFGSVKAKSRKRTVPRGSPVVAMLQTILQRSKFVGSDDLGFASSVGTPLNGTTFFGGSLSP